MKKLEKEVKVLDIDRELIEKRLNQLGAKKIEDSLQKSYVYDLSSIYARFYDCLLQLKQCNKTYELEVCRSKLERILFEVDNLTAKEEQERLEEIAFVKLFVDLLRKTSNEELFNRFSDSKIVDIVKRYEINPNKWVRLRQTNDKTTLTIKHILNPDLKVESDFQIQKVIETEMEVPSIEEGNAILEQLGFNFRNYQEKKRTTYILDGVEIDIDTWPLIPMYIEIEDDSESKIYSIIKKLGLQEKRIVSCNTDEVYRMYGLDILIY